MKAVILYHPNQEFAGLAEDYAKEFHKRHEDKKIELISLDTTEGSEMARLYDVVRYPAILAISEDGALLKFWQDQPWPLMDEVSAYSVPAA